MFIASKLLKPSQSKACASKLTGFTPIFAHFCRPGAAQLKDTSSPHHENLEGGRPSGGRGMSIANYRPCRSRVGDRYGGEADVEEMRGARGAHGHACAGGGERRLAVYTEYRTRIRRECK